MGQRIQGLPKRKLAREIETVRLRVRSMGKEYLPALLRTESSIYSYTKLAPFGGAEVSLNGLHPACCSKHYIFHRLGIVHSRLSHHSATRHCTSALQLCTGLHGTTLQTPLTGLRPALGLPPVFAVFNSGGQFSSWLRIALTSLFYASLPVSFTYIGTGVSCLSSSAAIPNDNAPVLLCPPIPNIRM